MGRATAVTLAGLLACAGTAAVAHPDGTLTCAVRAETGGHQQLTAVDVELRFDEAHSAQAAEVVRAAPDAAPDPLRLERFKQVLMLEMGRWNWFVDVRQGGAAVGLRPGFPDLAWEDGLLHVRVRLQVDPPPGPSAGPWTLRCADPTYYWRTSIDRIAVVRADGTPACSAIERPAPDEARWRCADD